ncbi:MAG TPA: STAS domain-containing protein [Acidisarcina sp.]
MAINDPLTIERLQGKAPGTRILRLEGPLTLNNLFPFQAELRSETPPLTILDLAAVPYMDSAGMGAVIAYFVSSGKFGHKLLATGVNYRVLELFKLSQVDSLIPMFPTVDDAESATRKT